MNIPKQAFYFGENINYRLKIDTNGLFGKVKNIEEKLYRKIQWKGYLKNSVLDKKIYQDKYLSYNEKSEDITSTVLGAPLVLTAYCFDYSIDGCIIGGYIPYIFSGITESKILKGVSLVSIPIFGLFGSIFGLCYGAYKGIKKNIKYLGKTTNIDDKKINIRSNFNLNNKSEIEESIQKIIDILSEEEIKDEKIFQDLSINNNIKIEEEFLKEIKKFVYFKDEKIIGFTKFPENITPPVDGYYFKCNFYLDIELNCYGFITNNINLKNEIYYYDGEEYIKKMKLLFNTK